MTAEEMKAWLTERLGREVSISQVTINGTKCYLVDYVNHYAPATKLAGVTEDEAIANLFNYLQALKPLPDAADTASATKEQI